LEWGSSEKSWRHSEGRRPSFGGWAREGVQALGWPQRAGMSRKWEELEVGFWRIVSRIDVVFLHSYLPLQKCRQDIWSQIKIRQLLSKEMTTWGLENWERSWIPELRPLYFCIIKSDVCQLPDKGPSSQHTLHTHTFLTVSFLLGERPNTGLPTSRNHLHCRKKVG
jgi:hypothetical protein